FVVAASRSGRLALQAKAQAARTVLRSVQEVVEFLKVTRTALQLVFDHAPAPCIGAGVAHGAGNSLELGELVNGAPERKLEGIERDCVFALQVAIAVAEAADERPVAHFF